MGNPRASTVAQADQLPKQPIVARAPLQAWQALANPSILPVLPGQAIRRPGALSGVCIDVRLDPRQLARAQRDPTPRVPGRRRTRGDRAADGAAAAAGDLVGGGGTARASGAGCPGRGLPPAGRRLRGEFRRVRCRADHGEAEDPVQHEPGADLRVAEAGDPGGEDRRAVREAPKHGPGRARRGRSAGLPRRPDQSRPRSRPRTALPIPH